MLFDRDEAALVNAAKAGDGSAFAELIRPEYRTAFRVAFGMLHDVDEAEDAVQDASFTAWRRLDNLHPGKRLRPWFLAIVANRCRSVSKGHWSGVIKGERIETEAEPIDLAGSLDVRRALRRLDHDERLVVVLRYYLDMPFEEIAVTLGITSKAARRRLERAVNRLRPIVLMERAAV